MKQQNISEPEDMPVEKQETQKGRQAETAEGPSFESLLKLTETPSHIKEVLGKLDLRGLDFKSALEQIDNVIIGELIKNPEGEVAKDLRKYQAKIDELLNEMEKNEFTFAGARQNFENAVIAKLAKEEKINLADGALSLNWFVDDETPDGKFALVQDLGIKEEAGEYITLKDTKTGKMYREKKFVEPGNSYKTVAKLHYLKTEQVKEIFNKLEPAVKKSFLDGLRDAEAEAKKLFDPNYRKKLKITDKEAEEIIKNALAQTKELEVLEKIEVLPKNKALKKLVHNPLD